MKNNAPSKELELKILNIYEALEGMIIIIYSGKIIAITTDDGINASGEYVERGPRPDWNRNRINRTRINRSKDDPFGPGPNRNRSHRIRGNTSFYIFIYDGEIYVYFDRDDIDSNRIIFIHGDNINVFSQGNRDNEFIDHNENLTLFNGDVLGLR